MEQSELQKERRAENFTAEGTIDRVEVKGITISYDKKGDEVISVKSFSVEGVNPSGCLIKMLGGSFKVHIESPNRGTKKPDNL